MTAAPARDRVVEAARKFIDAYEGEPTDVFPALDALNEAVKALDAEEKP